MGSLVGQTEAQHPAGLRIADAMAPCVVMIDEVEKALAGVASSGQTDSGVSARLFGTFLTWLNDHESDVFVVCTANDVTRLPPEFAGPSGSTASFFLDLPGRAARRTRSGRCTSASSASTPSQRRPRDADWTGAEIKACCRLAALLDVPLVEAAQNIVPVAVTRPSRSSGCGTGPAAAAWPPTGPGSTPAAGGAAGKPGRNVGRDPSSN